jgi:hypothetical protein
VAAAVVAASFFLPWVAVPREEAEHFRAEMTRRLADEDEPLPAGVAAEDWRHLAEIPAATGEVSGLDVFFWARTAHTTALAYERRAAEGTLREDAEAAEGATAPPEAETSSVASSVSRALLLVAVVLAGVHVAAIAVALGFLLVRLRHAPSPLLILTLLTGALAVVIPAAYSIVEPALGFATEPRTGLLLLLPAGGVLLLTGIFGVRRRNWWRVLFGTLLVGGLLAAVVWGYVSTGT